MAEGRPGPPRPRSRAGRARRPRRKARAGERPRRDRCREAVGGRRELAARGLSGRQGSRAHPRVRRGGAVVSVGLYGQYGGRYVPETLIPALDELTAAWNELREEADFRRDLEALLRDYGG